MTANHAHTPDTEQVRLDYIQSCEGDRVSAAESGPQFDRWHAAEIAAAEQRGAVKELKQLLQELMEGEFQVGHHAGLHTASTIISARLIELLVNADQMEGDDETH